MMTQLTRDLSVNVTVLIGSKLTIQHSWLSPSSEPNSQGSEMPRKTEAGSDREQRQREIFILLLLLFNMQNKNTALDHRGIIQSIALSSVVSLWVINQM